MEVYINDEIAPGVHTFEEKIAKSDNGFGLLGFGMLCGPADASPFWLRSLKLNSEELIAVPEIPCEMLVRPVGLGTLGGTAALSGWQEGPAKVEWTVENRDDTPRVFRAILVGAISIK